MARRFTFFFFQAEDGIRHKDCIRYHGPCRRTRIIVVSVSPCSKRRVPYRPQKSVDPVAQRGWARRRDVDLVEGPPESAMARTKLGEIVAKIDGNKIEETQLLAQK